MTDLNPISSPPRAADIFGPAPSLSSVALSVLSDPSGSAFSSSDPLSELMMALQKQSDASLSLSTLRIQDTRGALNDQLEQYLEKVKEICEKLEAAKAEQDDGGWFSDCFDFVGDLVGELVGTLVDLQVDLITLPVDLGVDVVKNINDPAAMMQAMQSTCGQLAENGTVADDVHGFTKGVVAFTADLTELTARLQVDLAKGALTGEGLSQAIGGDLKKLWGSLKSNVLDNPHFWAVTGAVAKGVAVAGAVMTGGALAPVAIGLMVLMEADQRTGFIEKLAGKDLAPWVRMGLAVGAAACLGFAGGSDSRLLDALRLATGLVQGAGNIYSGYHAIVSANEQADAIDDQAELTTSMNRMQRLQRLLESLLSSLDEDAKSNEQTKKLGASLMQTQVATNAALILPA